MKPLFYHITDIVAYKLVVVSNKSLSTGTLLAKYTTNQDEPFTQIKFLKEENWKDYIKDNSIPSCYENPIELTEKHQLNIKSLLNYVPAEFQSEYADAIPRERATISSNIQVTTEPANDSQNIDQTADNTLSSKVKEKIPLLLDILQDIKGDTINKIPKAYKPNKKRKSNPTKTNGAHMNRFTL